DQLLWLRRREESEPRPLKAGYLGFSPGESGHDGVSPTVESEEPSNDLVIERRGVTGGLQSPGRFVPEPTGHIRGLPEFVEERIVRLKPLEYTIAELRIGRELVDTIQGGPLSSSRRGQ